MPDLDELPGVRALRERSQGDPRVVVAVIDGTPRTDHPAFQGADVRGVRGYWLDDREEMSWATGHATHIASVIFGQPGSSVEGLAPRCRGLFIATGPDEDAAESEIGVARAIEYALSQGAQIIHCAFCHPSQSGATQSWLLDAARKAEEMGAVIVAPAGNDYGENWCVPSALPTVLAVGALTDDNAPMPFTNFGSRYEGHSIMGPGENVLGADPDGGTVMQKGTSVAAPVLSGIIAALTSAQVQAGRAIQPQRVRQVLLDTARPGVGEGAERFIGGIVSVDRALAVLLDGMSVDEARRAFPDLAATGSAVGALPIPPGQVHTDLPPHSVARHFADGAPVPREAYKRPDLVETSNFVGPSLRYPALTFAIGQVHAEYPDQLTKDSFASGMGIRLNPGEGIADNVDALVAYLDAHPDEARRLRWVLSINGHPRYVIRPVGAYGSQVFDMLAALILSSAHGRTELASAPGWSTATMVALASGSVVRELRVNSLRGVYGWQPTGVADQSLAAVAATAQSAGTTPAVAGVGGESDESVFGAAEPPSSTWPSLLIAADEAVRSAVVDFLTGVYFRADQEPEVSRDRALNFAATNGFQIAAAFVDAMGSAMEFVSHRLEYSPFSRVGGNCWDIVLTFRDPNRSVRAGVEYRFTVDVADSLPVTVGRTRRWALPL